MPEAVTTQPRDRALDGLRGLAALSVVGFHAWLYRPDGLPGHRSTFTSHLFFELNLGLVAFFVLSGFLLYRPFARAAMDGRRVDLRPYVLRRAARILPGYYACIAGALVVYAAVGAPSLVPPAHDIALFAVFGQNYSLSTLTEIDAVTWTLCVEVLFYVTLPLLAWLAARRGGGAAPAVTAALLVVTLAWNQLVHDQGLGAAAAKTLPAYIGHFALGMTAAWWVTRRRVRAPDAWIVAGLAIVVATGYWHEHWGSRTSAHVLLAELPAAAGFALLTTGLAAGRSRLARAFAARPLRLAGTISYGTYLWHIPSILVLQHLRLLPHGLAARFAVVLVPTLALGAFSWRFVERPVMERAASRARTLSARALPRRRAAPTSEASSEAIA